MEKCKASKIVLYSLQVFRSCEKLKLNSTQTHPLKRNMKSAFELIMGKEKKTIHGSISSSLSSCNYEIIPWTVLAFRLDQRSKINHSLTLKNDVKKVTYI